jgi:hypothetical protein
MPFDPPSPSQTPRAEAFCSELPLPLRPPPSHRQCTRYIDLSMNMFRGTLPRFGSVVSAKPSNLNLDDVSVCRKYCTRSRCCPRANSTVMMWRRDENIAFHILGYLAPPNDPLRLRLVLRPQCSGSKSTYVSDKQGDL